MPGVDFQTLYPQLMGQWQALATATPAQQRLLAIELAQVLADWEADQTADLTRIATLKRIGHWGALGRTVAEQLTATLGQLGAEKETLRNRLQETNERIAAGERAVPALRDEVAALETELAAGTASLDDLTREMTTLEQRLDALRQLQGLKAELDRAAAEYAASGSLEARLRDGADPRDALEGLIVLREALIAWYAAYIDANAEIAGAMATEGQPGSAPPLDAALRSVPERLLALDRELKDIDRILAEALSRQDAGDAEIRKRA